MRNAFEFAPPNAQNHRIRGVQHAHGGPFMTPAPPPPMAAPLALLMAMAAILLAGCEPARPPPPLPPDAPAPSEIASALAQLPAPYSSGDYLAGRRVYLRCRGCHLIQKGAGARVGPNLHGIVGRASGQAAGFVYSPAMANAHRIWDAPTLDAFLANPRENLPGTRMGFIGLRNEAERRDVIAYLRVEGER